MKQIGLLMIILIGAFVSAIAQSSKQCLPLWLEGTWENVSEPGLRETWAIAGDNSMQGLGWTITDKDTLLTEALTIECDGSMIKYSAFVKGQNQGRWIAFQGLLLDDSSFLVENPAHDFPQAITYTVLPDNTLITSLSGAEKTCASSEWRKSSQDTQYQKIAAKWKQ